MGGSGRQLSFDFDLYYPITEQRAFVLPKQHMKEWPEEGDHALVSSLKRSYAVKGGKLCLYRNSIEGECGYLVVEGYDRLFELFEVQFENLFIPLKIDITKI